MTETTKVIGRWESNHLKLSVHVKDYIQRPVMAQVFALNKRMEIHYIKALINIP